MLCHLCLPHSIGHKQATMVSRNLMRLVLNSTSWYKSDKVSTHKSMWDERYCGGHLQKIQSATFCPMAMAVHILPICQTHAFFLKCNASAYYDISSKSRIFLFKSVQVQMWFFGNGPSLNPVLPLLKTNNLKKQVTWPLSPSMHPRYKAVPVTDWLQ